MLCSLPSLNGKRQRPTLLLEQPGQREHVVASRPEPTGPVSEMALTQAEENFEEILQIHGFMTANMKQQVKAPSLQGESDFIILPDILAVDKKGRGWCFEVKDEQESKTPMRMLTMTHGYSGPAWYLDPLKAKSYLRFSQVFSVPCMIAIRGKRKWRLGFFTRKIRDKIEYNKDIVASGWDNPKGIPILFNVMLLAGKFLEELDNVRHAHWGD